MTQEEFEAMRIQRQKCLDSFLYFIQVFFKLLTKRDFVISRPIGRESHIISVCRELTDVFYLKENRLIINIPPGHFKSTILTYFIAWCYAHYGDCNFLYISHTKELATNHTFNIKKIMSLPEYRDLFGIKLRTDSSAKDNFQTMQGGKVMAFGSAGAITGMDAGLPHCTRFSGAVIMDDMHKIDEAHSDTIRESVIDNYNETIKPRPRGNNVPLIFLGQRVHEGDLPAFLLEGNDGYHWRTVILRGLDEADNALCPDVKSKEALIIERDVNPYVFWSQYQQQPQPPGGSLFKEEDFVLLEEEPEYLTTFITGDTAETDKSYNDPTVFSFWGLYKIKSFDAELDDLYGLHLIDQIEEWVLPDQLEPLFRDFYFQCMRHKTKPRIVAIEKKSTGVTLLATIKKIQGLEVRDIERTKASGSKTTRFLEMQPFIASRCVSLSSHGKLWSMKGSKRVNLFIDHMTKITANMTHRYSDIADTTYDAIKSALIDKAIYLTPLHSQQNAGIVSGVVSNLLHQSYVKDQAYGRSF